MNWNSTIKPKLKVCVSCNEERLIFARGLCTICYKKEQQEKQREKAKTKPKKVYTIPKFSKNMEKELAKYRPLRDKYMKEHPICEYKGCKKPSQDLHHKARRGKNLSNVSTFMAVCRNHHIYIEDNPLESKENGYLT